MLDTVMGLVGGLALFLFGMDQLTRGLQQAAGARLKGMIAGLTGNRFAGLGVGALFTGVVQSSTVTTVLCVGLIGSGLMSLQQSLGVILGAKIGTTVTGQIVAFQASHYALFLVAIGFAPLFLARHERWRQVGAMVMGLGLVFYGINLMSGAAGPLREHEGVLAALAQLDHPWLAALVGAVATAILQSSSATIGIAIVLAAQGLLGPDAALGLVLGINLGATSPTVLAAWQRNRAAQRAAIFTVGFVLVGVLLALLCFGAFSALVDRLPGASDPARRLANAHTAFAIIDALLFLPLLGLAVSLLERCWPDLPARPGMRPQFLDPTLLATPELALTAAECECARLAGLVRQLVAKAGWAALTGSAEAADALREREDDTDILHRALLAWLRRLAAGSLTASQSATLARLLAVADHLEQAGDLAAQGLAVAARERIDRGLSISQATRDVLRPLMAACDDAYDHLTQALNGKREAAEQVRAAKPAFRASLDAVASHLAKRLGADDPERIATYRLEAEILGALRQLHSHARQAARALLSGE